MLDKTEKEETTQYWVVARLESKRGGSWQRCKEITEANLFCDYIPAQVLQSIEFEGLIRQIKMKV